MGGTGKMKLSPADMYIVVLSCRHGRVSDCAVLNCVFEVGAA